MTTAGPAPLSYEAYQALEAATHRKHEFESGVVTMMGGGSLDHALISANLIGALGNLLAGSGCRTYSSDAKVWIGTMDSAFYPDASVVCGPPIRAFHDRHALVNPTVVAEVLSPGTRGRDATTKLAAYKTLSTLRHCLLVDSEKVLVMHYERQPDDRWVLADFHALGDSVALPLKQHIALPLSEIYEGAEFLLPPTEAAPPPSTPG